MKEVFVKIRNSIISFLYQKVLKKVLFLMDPENVHDRFIKVGKLLGRISFFRFAVKFKFGYSHPNLRQQVLGIDFDNPIGLAAGFDKDAELTDILPSVGFGFEEVGSITGESCQGNPKPRLWRLPKSKSLVVYYGLKNDGCEAISKRLANKKFKFPIGVSIAKTNSENTCQTDQGIADYVKAFKVMQGVGDYYTINISCPNAFGGQPFTDKKRLEKLFTLLDQVECEKPVFIKLSPDLSTKELDDIIDLAENHRVQGFVCTNLTKDKVNPKVQVKIKDSNVPEVGGMSGKVVEDLTNGMIRYVYNKTQGKYIIVGCGGVFTAHDAYLKIKSGATLIQMITGMIYQGPQVISTINLGLVELLEKDGYKNISEAIGQDS